MYYPGSAWKDYHFYKFSPHSSATACCMIRRNIIQ